MAFGIDQLAADGFAPLKGKKVGLYTNLSAVSAHLIPTVETLCHAVDLVTLFSPEHGLAGMAQDGVKVASGLDSHTGLMVHSLYGENFAPTSDMLESLDVMVCDIQDIGVRYYTFLWTLTHILEACGGVGLPVLILDRPNPLGKKMDGGGLDPALASLVGRFPIPIQHGMTLGELARMINQIWNPTPAEVEIIPHNGEIAPFFVPPSPNMPHLITAQHYAGACLVEGTELSEGRGTALPFEIVGAPYIDSWRLSEAINAQQFKGAVARPYMFRPSASKFAGQVCGGIHLHIIDSNLYRPLEVWLGILKIIYRLYPENFAWLPPANGIQHFDRLIGDGTIRAKIEANESLENIMADWGDFLREFDEKRQDFLLYRRGA